MPSIKGTLFEFRRLEQLAAGDTALHRLDPRAKALTAFIFIVTVISFDRHELTALFPFFLFPAVLIGLGDLPAVYLMKKVALLCPFALSAALFAPLLDRADLVQLGPYGVSGGWISCVSIVVRAVLTIGASFVLLALTGFPAITAALEKFGMPAVFTTQLLFVYRYIFVLTDEGGRVHRARDVRSLGKKGLDLRTYGSLLGYLLLRTWRRAERVHGAMVARGFTGAFPTQKRSRFGPAEAFFVLGWSLFFLIFRIHNGAELLGSLVTGMLS